MNRTLIITVIVIAVIAAASGAAWLMLSGDDSRRGDAPTQATTQATTAAPTRDTWRAAATALCERSAAGARAAEQALGDLRAAAYVDAHRERGEFYSGFATQLAAQESPADVSAQAQALARALEDAGARVARTYTRGSGDGPAVRAQVRGALLLARTDLAQWLAASDITCAPLTIDILP